MTNIMQNGKQQTANQVATANGVPITASISQGPIGSVQSAGVGLQKKSLNREARKRELLKITMEN
jgi:predicted nucleotide-binding protein